MQHYIGLDVSMKTTSICIVNKDGKIVLEENVVTDPATISAVIKNSKLSVDKIAFESGSISHWLGQELASRGLPSICIDSRKMAAVLSININKTDKNDARLIAEALRWVYSEVQQRSQENVEMRTLISSRRTLKDISIKLKNTIRGHLKLFGIRLGSLSSAKFIDKINELLKQRSEIIQSGLSELVLAFKNIEQQLDKLEKKIEELARGDADIQLLKTIPGIGNLTAFSFKICLGDPKRFKNSRAVGAYFGMTPRQYSSGETIRQGKVSKRGSSEMRFLLNEAATVMLYRTKLWCRPKAWGLKIKKKSGHKKATMAIGRKLCTIMHRILITRKPFEYGEQKKKEAELMKKAC